MLANDRRCTSETKSGITMVKAASNKQSALFTTKMDLEFRKKLAKCYIWSIALYGAESWTLLAIRNTRKVLKCNAGDGWRSVGPIM
jgi:hypothetical protein